MRLFISVLLLLAAVPASAQHWCNKDRSGFNPTELAICGTPQLVALDIQMAQAFYSQRDRLSGDQRARFETGQFRYWLPYRNACQRDRSCLMQRYAARIAELNGAPMPEGGQPGPGQIGTSGEMRVTPEGYLEYQDAATGATKVYNPINMRTGTRRGDGIDWQQISFVTASPLDLPDLSLGNEAWIRTAFSYTNTLLDSMLSPDAAAIVRGSAPSDTESGRTTFYLRMMNRILELQS